MVSSFHGLELGKRALTASQAQITTTSHNIANANTKGYSRQQVLVDPSHALSIYTNGKTSQLGTGVLINSIIRVRDQYLDQQYRNQTSGYGEWSIKQETLSQLESVINEPSETGLSQAINEFWDAWENLANHPDSMPARAVITERVQALIDMVKSMDQSMDTITNTLKNKQTNKLDEANHLIDQIAELNKSIKIAGNNANDLLDQRDVLVEELSKLVNVKVEEKNGMYNIKLEDDTSLINGLTVENHLNLNSAMTSGELVGLSKSIETVNDYQTKLTNMVKDLIFGEMTLKIPNSETVITVNGINGLSQLGWSLVEDENGNSLNGAPIFKADPDQFSLKSLEINPDIKNNLGLIAASLRSEQVNGQTKVIIGNGELAQLIASLRLGDANNNNNIGSSFQTLVSQLGEQSNTAMNQLKYQEASLIATENRRQSITGVSLDEEMANLIKYQHAYNAAAKIVTVTDEILDTLINRVAP